MGLLHISNCTFKAEDCNRSPRNMLKDLTPIHLYKIAWEQFIKIPEL